MMCAGLGTVGCRPVLEVGSSVAHHFVIRGERLPFFPRRTWMGVGKTQQCVSLCEALVSTSHATEKRRVVRVVGLEALLPTGVG
jgi:hypothetical protein